MPIHFIAALAFLALAGCGTKTPLTLPPQTPQKASLVPVPSGNTGQTGEARPESRP